MNNYDITPAQKRIGKVLGGIVEFIVMTLIVFGLVKLAAVILLPIILPILGAFELVEMCGFLSCLFNSDIHSLVMVYIFSFLLTIVGSCLS